MRRCELDVDVALICLVLNIVTHMNVSIYNFPYSNKDSVSLHLHLKLHFFIYLKKTKNVSSALLPHQDHPLLFPFATIIYVLTFMCMEHLGNVAAVHIDHFASPARKPVI